eukprot:Skav215957  [mRNA]  locus=scaffold226:1004718:1009548:+ [translate_table: standard]
MDVANCCCLIHTQLNNAHFLTPTTRRHDPCAAIGASNPKTQRCSSVMALLMRLPFLLAVVQAVEEPSCEQPDLSMSLLQKQQSLGLRSCSRAPKMAALHPRIRCSICNLDLDIIRTQAPKCGYLTNGIGDPETFFNNNCKNHIHGDECNRPIPDIMAEHPGVELSSQQPL